MAAMRPILRERVSHPGCSQIDRQNQQMPAADGGQSQADQKGKGIQEKLGIHHGNAVSEAPGHAGVEPDGQERTAQLFRQAEQASIVEIHIVAVGKPGEAGGQGSPESREDQQGQRLRAHFMLSAV